MTETSTQPTDTRRQAVAAIRVVRQMTYTASRGGTFSYQHIEGQLTECVALGHRFFVREASDPAMSFFICANERWGMKHDGVSRRLQILELASEPSAFEALRDLVAAADHLERTVHRNRRFTERWALAQFEKRRSRV